MGGIGSGDWHRYDSKSTVEESAAVAVGEFRGRLFPGASGIITWTWAGGRQSSAGYVVEGPAGWPILTLHYRWRDQEDVRVPIRLQTTATNFNGERWWFTCPLIVGGFPCNRRVGKVYLPPGARYFGCRTCHGLTYRSCQEAHQAERLLGTLGSGLGFDPAIAKLLAARMAKS
ncbi:MAG: hypothetical protein HYX69_17855 [Planctomycetia bacterium]|nr:hypothetical protein [Planctomycetia bacterium]